MSNRFKLIAGPCIAESKEMLVETLEYLLRVVSMYDIDFYFKSSYKKANRTSYDSFTGVGDELALSWFDELRKEYGVKVLTDIHSVEDAKLASNYVDVLQIPAFLARQSDLLFAAAETNLPVNIKKGQFMAPDDMKKAAEKVVSRGNPDVWLTERGTFFGYHDLIVDFRSLIRMREFGYPVIYDATHSVQQPSIGAQSGGFRDYIKKLALGATAVGIDGIFFETHPDPENAKSDSATQLKLENAKDFIDSILLINSII